MAGTWNGYDDWLKKAQDSGWFFSDFDLYHASQDPNYAFQTYQNKSDYYNADTPEARALANANQESLRGTKGFSGGSSGDRYDTAPMGQGSNPTSFTGETGDWLTESQNAYTSWKNTPLWQPTEFEAPDPFQHSDWYNETRDALQNHGPFEYDYSTDPLYSVYKKEYTREGQRASADALAQAAAMTGGVPSSYANMVGQQAGNYYAAQLADKIPELRQQAYNEYNQDLSNLLAKYNAAYSGDQFDYGMHQDDYNNKYNLWRDSNELARLANQQQYERNSDLLGFAYGRYDQEQAHKEALDELQREQDADKIWAFGDGDPYGIGSYLGKYFVANAQPGQTMQGGDGSIWTKNADGSITITRNGKTWTIAAPAKSGGGYGRPVQQDETAGTEPRVTGIIEMGQGPLSAEAAAKYIAEHPNEYKVVEDEYGNINIVKVENEDPLKGYAPISGFTGSFTDRFK